MQQLASGHTAAPLDEELRKTYCQNLVGPWNEVVRLQPGGWILTKEFLKHQHDVYNFKFRPDDVIVMTYPKCGTTWMQTLVWTMIHNPDLNNSDAKDLHLFVRSPYLEMDMLITADADDATAQMVKGFFYKGMDKYCKNPDENRGYMFQIAENHTGRRVIKTHLPLSMFPKNLLDICKVVYVSRNPKDNLVSNLHHNKTVEYHGYKGTLDTFIDYYTKGLLIYGSFAEHLKEAHQMKDHPNLHLVFYEEMKNDITKQIKSLEKFMGIQLSESQVQNVINETDFNHMKKNDPHNIEAHVSGENKEGTFFRKGIAGSWKGVFTAEQDAKLDSWINEKLTSQGIKFQFE